jgi:hypothetical protein
VPGKRNLVSIAWNYAATAWNLWRVGGHWPAEKGEAKKMYMMVVLAVSLCAILGGAGLVREAFKESNA